MKLKFWFWKRQYFRYLFSVINIPLSSIIFFCLMWPQTTATFSAAQAYLLLKANDRLLTWNKVLFSTLISKRDNKFKLCHSGFPQKNILINCCHLLEWQVKVSIFHDDFCLATKLPKGADTLVTGTAFKGGYTGIKIIMLLKLQSNA